MNIQKPAIFAFVFMIASSTAAFAQSTDFYFSAAPKYSFYGTIELPIAGQVDGMPGSAVISLDIPSTLGVEGAIGLARNRWRAGVVVAHSSSESFSPMISQASGIFNTALYTPQTDEFRHTDISLEIVHDFLSGQKITPYVGIKGGASFVDYQAPGGGVIVAIPFANLPSIGDFLTFDSVSTDGQYFRAAIIGGLEYEITKSVSIFAQGEYARIFGLNFELDGIAGDFEPCPAICFAPFSTVTSNFSGAEGSDLSQFSASAGIRIQF